MIKNNKKHMHLLFPLIVSLFPILCSAQESCSDILSSQYSVGGHVEKKQVAKTLLQANDFEQVLSDVNSLSGSLTIPNEIKVTIDDKFDTSHFSFLDWSIQVGIKEAKYPSGKNAHPKEILPALAHEYGHSIFEKNLEINNPQYIKLRADYVQTASMLKLISTEIKRIQNDINLKKDVAFTEKRKLELASKQTELNNLIEALQKKIIYLETVWAVRRAFHEFFADVTAVTYSKDPEAISEVLLDLKKAKARENITYRDFEMDQPKYLRKWIKSSPEFIKYGDHYSLMLPARWDFWNLVKTRIQSENYRKQIIPRVFGVLNKYYAEIMSVNPEDVSQYSLAHINEINSRVMKDLTRALQ